MSLAVGIVVILVIFAIWYKFNVSVSTMSKPNVPIANSSNVQTANVNHLDDSLYAPAGASIPPQDIVATYVAHQADVEHTCVGVDSNLPC